VLVHKNNTDGKGAAYGTHENYLVPRAVPFGRLTRQLLPFFVSRLLFVGAGRIGTELDGPVRFQLSQRADFFEVEVGLETTLKRPLMNTRDEPHADPDRYRRLHVINGDANLCEVATFLKVGTMLLLLDVIEDDALPPVPVLADPVRAFHAVSHDLACTRAAASSTTARPRPRSSCSGGTSTPASATSRSGDGPIDPVTADVLERWEAVLTTAARSAAARRAGRLGHQARAARGYRERHGSTGTTTGSRWSTCSTTTSGRTRGSTSGWRHVAGSSGWSPRRRSRRRSTPRRQTPGVVPGRVHPALPREVVAAGWDALIFDVGRDALQRVPMMEPGRGTRERPARCWTGSGRPPSCWTHSPADRGPRPRARRPAR
jgi:Pup amidohydrolase